MNQIAANLTPATGLSPALQLAALLQSTGIAPLDRTGWIRVTGEDRVRWLNGMVTNSIQQLTPGTGNYNFILSVQGRIQGEANIYSPPDPASADLLIETAAGAVPSLITLLDRFIIMDDVELADITSTQSGLLVSGPQTASLLQQIGINVVSLEELTRQTISWNEAQVTAIHGYSPLVPHFELWADANTAANLSRALLEAGATLCEQQSRDWLRLLEGTPLYGTDIRDRELPQETAQTRALHFAKGCYLGQEIVERIRSRGNVHRTLHGFRLEGSLPTPGTVLEADGKPSGELTSTAAIPLSNGTTLQLALGYVRREALDRATPLTYPDGVATPVSLPFSAVEAFGFQAASEPPERA
jgi:folate-binding protein YgfZ